MQTEPVEVAAQTGGVAEVQAKVEQAGQTVVSLHSTPVTAGVVLTSCPQTKSPTPGVVVQAMVGVAH